MAVANTLVLAGFPTETPMNRVDVQVPRLITGEYNSGDIRITVGMTSYIVLLLMINSVL